MEKEKLILIFLVFVLMTPLLVANEECKKDLTVYIQFKAFDEENPYKLSKYQAPDYKEDDLLGLWKIIVLNEGTCKSVEAQLKLNLTNEKESINHFFCIHQIFIPPLEPKDSYYIIREGFQEKDINENQIVELPFYVDSNGKNFTSCLTSMLTTGLWGGKLDLEAIKSDESIGSWGYSMLIDDNNAGHLRFKVRPKQEILSLEYQRNSLYVVVLMGFLTLLVGLVSVVIMYKTSKKQILKMDEQYKKQTKKEDEREEGKQLDLINSLYVELEKISNKNKLNEGNLQWFKENFKKGKPLHSIWTINVSPYMENLNSSFRDESLTDLKRDIIKIGQKIEMINDLVLSGRFDLKNSNLRDFIGEVIKETIKTVEEVKKFIKIIGGS